MSDVRGPAGMSRAPVDDLRALPYPLAIGVLARLEAEHGPEAVAALRYELDSRGEVLGFWSRPSQRLPGPAERWGTLVITGDYGTGKTWVAVQLFMREILAGRSTRPRIICATRTAIEGTIVNGPSGILAWLPPDVPREWFPSKGHAGELWIAGVKITCISADAPGQAIGEGSDLDLRDDVAKWAITAGAKGAQEAWVAARKSCREGEGRAIVPTTPDGVDFIQGLLRGEERRVRVVDLGGVEENRGNLAPGFLDAAKDLREQGLWLRTAGASPFAAMDFAALRLDACPPLVEIGIAIDPADTSGGRACEVGIVGGGRDARDVVHVRRDVSDQLDSDHWPAVAWDLAEELQAEFPGVPWHFVVETNRGRSPPAALLRGEEKLRLAKRGKPAIPTCEIREVRADRDKCERAVSPAGIAARGYVRFARGLGTLEGQMRNLTPAGKNSDRADAAVHLVSDLAGLDEKSARAAAEQASEADEAAAQAAAAAEMSARLAALRRGAQPEPGPMKVEGAPPGDARHAGPEPRTASRPAMSWRSRGVL